MFVVEYGAAENTKAVAPATTSTPEVPIRDEERKGCIWTEYDLGDSGRCVVVAQQILKNLGYYKGDITGVVDEATRAAIIKLQQATEGLKVTGKLDPPTWGVLLWYANPEQKCWIVPSQEGCEWLQEKLAPPPRGPRTQQAGLLNTNTLILLAGAGALAFLIFRKKEK